MTSKRHKKHADLRRPEGGKFHRQEIALIGAPCGVIQSLSRQIKEAFPGAFRVGYADAAHHHEEGNPDFHQTYMDMIGHHKLTFHQEHAVFTFRSYFNDSDLVLVNGNHFKAARQIVLVHEQKRESLQKKLDRLTDVMLFVLCEGQEEVFDFLKESVPDISQVPVLKLSDVTKIAEIIERDFIARLPKVNGMVLAGGKSVRMGQDKGAIEYHGKPQREYAADLLNGVCDEVFLSVGDGQVGFQSAYPMVPDTFRDLGPFGGILSAFRHDPNRAWLIIATDIPFLDEETLRHLVDSRDPSKVAICFHNPEAGFPEPLITLWEPRAYKVLLQFLADGYTCPRKVLINSDVKQLDIKRKEILTNVNTPEEKDAILKRGN